MNVFIETERLKDCFQKQSVCTAILLLVLLHLASDTCPPYNDN